MKLDNIEKFEIVPETVGDFVDTGGPSHGRMPSRSAATARAVRSAVGVGPSNRSGRPGWIAAIAADLRARLAARRLQIGSRQIDPDFAREVGLPPDPMQSGCLNAPWRDHFPR